MKNSSKKSAPMRTKPAISKTQWKKNKQAQQEIETSKPQPKPLLSLQFGKKNEKTNKTAPSNNNTPDYVPFSNNHDSSNDTNTHNPSKYLSSHKYDKDNQNYATRLPTDMYRQAAHVMDQMKKHKGGVKNLVYSDERITHKKSVFALVTESNRYKEILDHLMDSVRF
eukprot:TRINITY_DN9863_c0_g1_i1.p1 TRINITY_DN9863_c0_g1~~TRINITY_DN9863_c0_g1_i1.p1  ORF type:complete len:167 (-),score=38.92 TRINITY_DN9863_c0_g1_i1:6-506(-)